ncbi:hypothetical protein BGZ76_004096 [Entomortierella beljakovae]|nr:hypothetical protein BGZ76_004096 [Entomortierella beljakovae]
MLTGSRSDPCDWFTVMLSNTSIAGSSTNNITCHTPAHQGSGYQRSGNPGRNQSNRSHSNEHRANMAPYQKGTLPRKEVEIDTQSIRVPCTDPKCIRLSYKHDDSRCYRYHDQKKFESITEPKGHNKKIWQESLPLLLWFSEDCIAAIREDNFDGVGTYFDYENKDLDLGSYSALVDPGSTISVINKAALKLINPKLAVKAVGSQTYTALLDPGATSSCIDNEDAEDLGIAYSILNDQKELPQMLADWKETLFKIIISYGPRVSHNKDTTPNDPTRLSSDAMILQLNDVMDMDITDIDVTEHINMNAINSDVNVTVDTLEDVTVKNANHSESTTNADKGNSKTPINSETSYTHHISDGVDKIVIDDLEKRKSFMDTAHNSVHLCPYATVKYIHQQANGVAKRSVRLSKEVLGKSLKGRITD